MRKISLAASTVVLSIAAAHAQTPVASRLAAQNALFEESWQAQLKLAPTLATSVGDYRYNDQLGDNSLAATTARRTADIAALARIKAISATGFPEQDLISHDLFERQLQQRIEDYEVKEYEMPLGGSGGGGGIHANLASIAGFRGICRPARRAKLGGQN